MPRRAAGTSEAPTDREALRALGLALRAGRAVVGTRAVREAARAGDLALVVLARDAGPNARSRLSGALARAEAPVVERGDRRALGAALGRGPTVVVGVLDPGLARRVGGDPRTKGERPERGPEPSPRQRGATGQDRQSSKQQEREDRP